MYTRHCESTGLVHATPQALFEHLDNPKRLAGHMSESSWMMGGGSMTIETDALAGRSVGSHVRLAGRVLGVRLHVDEIVTQREPPHEKSWETVGEPRLLVIGAYQMGFTVAAHDRESQLRVFIDYALPTKRLSGLLGRLVGGWYARWCTAQMVIDAIRQFGGLRTDPG